MLIIGEKINGTRKRVKQAVLDRDANFIKDLAISQVEAGAEILDINAGTTTDREPDDLIWLIQTVQEVVDKQLCLDSPNPAALAAGITVTKQTPMINSISAEPYRLTGILPLVAQHGCRVIALAMESNKIPNTCEGRMAIVRRLFEETRKAGVPDENMYVDALVMSVATDGNACITTLETMRTILKEFPKAHLTAGLSNVSFGLPARALVNRAFMTLALESGLDSAIMDPNERGLMETLLASNVLLGRDKHCMQYNRAFRAGKIGPVQEEKKLPAPELSPVTVG
jgi:5-methyltetrahydrofolate corrinoid/iron sulfur protein methyltransferase